MCHISSILQGFQPPVQLLQPHHLQHFPHPHPHHHFRPSPLPPLLLHQPRPLLPLLYHPLRLRPVLPSHSVHPPLLLPPCQLSPFCLHLISYGLLSLPPPLFLQVF